jgi:RNA polymerase subunit RPABC4/transcription elongation factor Spt4
MQEKEIKQKCRNCTYEVKKNIRRCPYCGILNPTVEIKEIMITIVVIISFMLIYTTFFYK